MAFQCMGAADQGCGQEWLRECGTSGELPTSAADVAEGGTAGGLPHWSLSTSDLVLVQVQSW